jgi:hypothetical protein
VRAASSCPIFRLRRGVIRVRTAVNSAACVRLLTFDV